MADIDIDIEIAEAEALAKQKMMGLESMGYLDNTTIGNDDTYESGGVEPDRTLDGFALDVAAGNVAGLAGKVGTKVLNKVPALNKVPNLLKEGISGLFGITAFEKTAGDALRERPSTMGENLLNQAGGMVGERVLDKFIKPREGIFGTGRREVDADFLNSPQTKTALSVAENAGVIAKNSSSGRYTPNVQEGLEGVMSRAQRDPVEIVAAQLGGKGDRNSYTESITSNWLNKGKSIIDDPIIREARDIPTLANNAAAKYTEVAQSRLGLAKEMEDSGVRVSSDIILQQPGMLKLADRIQKLSSSNKTIGQAKLLEEEASKFIRDINMSGGSPTKLLSIMENVNEFRRKALKEFNAGNVAAKERGDVVQNIDEQASIEALADVSDAIKTAFDDVLTGGSQITEGRLTSKQIEDRIAEIDNQVLNSWKEPAALGQAAKDAPPSISGLFDKGLERSAKGNEYLLKEKEKLLAMKDNIISESSPPESAQLFTELTDKIGAWASLRDLAELQAGNTLEGISERSGRRLIQNPGANGVSVNPTRGVAGNLLDNAVGAYNQSMNPISKEAAAYARAGKRDEVLMNDLKSMLSLNENPVVIQPSMDNGVLTGIKDATKRTFARPAINAGIQAGAIAPAANAQDLTPEEKGLAFSNMMQQKLKENGLGNEIGKVADGKIEFQIPPNAKATPNADFTGLPGYNDPYPKGLPRKTETIDPDTFVPEVLRRTKGDPVALELTNEMAKAFKSQDRYKLEMMHENLTRAYPDLFESGYGVNGRIYSLEEQNKYMKRLGQLKTEGRLTPKIIALQQNKFYDKNDLGIIPLDSYLDVNPREMLKQSATKNKARVELDDGTFTPTY